MRVLMLCWELPPYVTGGLGVATAGLIDGLKRIKVNVDAVLPQFVNTIPLPSSYSQTTSAQTEDYTVHKPDEIVTKEPSGAYNTFGAIWRKGVVDCLKQGMHLANDNSYDLIHCHDWLTVPAALELRHKFQLPIIMHVHSLESDRSGGGKGDQFIRRIEERGLNEATLIITVSNRTKQQIIREYKIPADKIHVVFNGFEYGDRLPPVVLDKGMPNLRLNFVGRLTRQKGPDYFIKMLVELKKMLPAVKVHIAGDGDMKQELQKLTVKYGLDNTTYFRGFLSKYELQKMLSEGGILVAPSRSEPFGLVAMEAAIRAMPVVLSEHYGAAEVLTTAETTKPENAKEMAILAASYLVNPDKYKSAGKALRKQARSCTWRRAAQQCHEVYKTMFAQQ